MSNRDEDTFPWSGVWPEIRSPRVRAAFAQVPRDQFVGTDYQRFADRDAPLPIGEGQTISQPFVVALMTQAVDPQPGETVLEVGTGSGFQTAILCELSNDELHESGELVYSVERFASLAARAAANLAALGYSPNLRTGDGAAGWPEAAPYRSVIVTAAAPCLPRPLWEQVDEGGRMVIPIGDMYGEQMLYLLAKVEGEIDQQALGPVRFVPLVSPLLEDADNCIELGGSFGKYTVL